MAETQKSELPNRRENGTTKIAIHTNKGKVSMYCTMGFYEDGTPGEIFIGLGQTGSDERSWIDAVARTVSVGLQYGVPIEKYIMLFRGTKGNPFGSIKGLEGAGFCAGPLDLIAKWMVVEAGVEVV